MEGQCSEAVRIRRRGGEGGVLNSKSEFNRSRIPRLVLEEQPDQERLFRVEQERLHSQLSVEDARWESQKAKERSSEHAEFMSSKIFKGASSKGKRELIGEGSIRASKRRKYVLMGEDWGERYSTSHFDIELGKLPASKLVLSIGREQRVYPAPDMEQVVENCKGEPLSLAGVHNVPEVRECSLQVDDFVHC